MPPKTIPCDNVREGGAVCGQGALVHMVHYMYDIQRGDSNEEMHVLRGVTYDVECPRCGRRQQVERYNEARVGLEKRNM